MTQWEEIDVPRGSFIGWGEQVGQHVTGKVIAYEENGGTDFAQNVCPRLDVELTEQAASFNKQGERTNYDAGEYVVLNCGLVSLKRAVRAAALSSGDLVKITLVSLAPSAKGTVKEFGIKVARGAGAQASQQAAPAQSFAAQPSAQASPAPPVADPWAAAPASAGAEPPF